MGMSTAFIAFGGNLGNVRQTFEQARHELDKTDDIRVLKSSKLYRTPPVGPAGQPDYLNAVIAIQTSLEPLQLLAQLQQIEHRHGRTRGERWGARTLDLDILAYDDLHTESEALTIPHAMMHERMFVLCPLCDIDSRWQHPLLRLTARDFLQHLVARGEAPLTKGEAW